MDILSCQVTDINEILSLYAHARDLQTKRGMVVWPIFDRSLVEIEILENRQFKIEIHHVIACNWAITFKDKEIWGERDKEDAVYIHRICTHPDFRGNRYIDSIVAWAQTYAREKGKPFVRLDTLGNNTKLIKHYTSAGFDFLGIFQLTDTANLPGHYQKEPNCCLFELKV